ncbi:hypothetical protein Dimus_000735 [Dionaea muscipula]
MEYAHLNQRRGVVLVAPHQQQLIEGCLVPSPIGVLCRPAGLVIPCGGLVVPLVGPFPLFPRASVLIRMDDERSRSLRQLMTNEGLIPSSDEELKRKSVIVKLKEIVLTWIKKVAWQRGLQADVIQATSATILTYGSYGLGVHDSDSDIDALCVGPWFATSAEDFFIVLYDMLKSQKEVSEIHCVKNARIPLMRFKFEGIPIDLPYAKLMFTSVPDTVEVLNPMILHGIDETSWKSLSGVRVNCAILQLVTNLKEFQSLLRCIKLWAKRRGIYGNLFGYLGGVHLAILAAFICVRNPDAMLSSLVAGFFSTFASWPWPMPVVLAYGTMSAVGDSNVVAPRSLMPIQMPCSPQEYCASNISKSTFNRIRSEFLRAQTVTKNLLGRDFDWHILFEPFVHHNKYWWFTKISLSASNQDDLGDWVGWVKSRFPCLILKLEEVLGFCDPNPAEEYTYTEKGDPNVVFYWGLHAHCDDSDISRVEQDFETNIRIGYEGPVGQMGLSIVQAPELPATVCCMDTNLMERKACWSIIPEFSPPMMYSEHLPSYLVRYVPSIAECRRICI